MKKTFEDLEAVPLKRIAVVQPVPFTGAQNKTLEVKDGTLVFYPDLGLVKAEPKRHAGAAQGIIRSVLIPVANIQFMEVLDVEAAKAKADADAAAKAAAEEAALEALTNPKPPVDDTYRPTPKGV